MSEIKTANASANYFAARPTILPVTIADPPSKPLSSRYDPERDALVNYEPNDPKMKPYGFSGAAAWCDRVGRSGPVWTASPMMFGVQTHAFMTSRSPSENCFLKGAAATENRTVKTTSQSSPHEARSNASEKASREQPAPL